MTLHKPQQKVDKHESSSETYANRSVERVCDILDLLTRSPRAVSLGTVAEATGLHKSSAFRYLAVLKQRRYVERDPETGDYRLGLALLPVHARPLEVLCQRAKPHLEKVRDQFAETVNLGVLDGRRVIYAQILESPKAMRLSARPRDRDYIHSTALGKAIAAHLPEAQVSAVLETEGMAGFTRRTITQPERYFEELRKVRNQGYAIDDQENEEEGRCLGVPIFGYHVPAAISLSAPETRFPMERVEEAAAALLGAAQRISEELTSG